MRRGAFTAVAMAVTLGLLAAGCSDGDAGTQPSPSTSGGQSVAETTTPSPTQTVQPPVMPAAAKKADLAGAEAFLRFYWATVNHAWATGDTGALEPLRSSECAACMSMEKSIQDAYAKGGRLEGGEMLIGDVVVTPGDPKKPLNAGVVVSQARGKQIGPDGSVVHDIPAAEAKLYRFIVEFSGSWKVDQWGNYEVEN